MELYTIKISIVSEKKTYELNYHLLLRIFMLFNYSAETSNKIISEFIAYIKKKNNTKDGIDKLIIKKNQLNDFMLKIKEKYKNTIVKNLYPYFFITHSLIKSNKGLIILIGGASGTGKSSITSYLGQKMGINTIFSTDTLRHISRNYLDYNKEKFLFCSTYECHLLSNDINKSFKEKLIEGYKKQSKLIQKYLINLLKIYYDQGKWIIIEGVHLTPDFMFETMKKFNRTISFYFYISDNSKHAERLSTRVKNNSIEKNNNKYIKHLESIVQIQEYNKELSKKYKVPSINNKNIDETFKIIYKTILRCLKILKNDKTLLDSSMHNCHKLLYQFKKVKEKYKNNQIINKNVKDIKKNTFDKKKEKLDKHIIKEKKFEKKTQKKIIKRIKIKEILEKLEKNKKVIIKKSSLKTTFSLMKDYLNKLFDNKIKIIKENKDKYIIKKINKENILLKNKKKNFAEKDIENPKINNKKNSININESKISDLYGDCSNENIDSCNISLRKDNWTFRTNGTEISNDNESNTQQDDKDLSYINESFYEEFVSVEINSEESFSNDYDKQLE